MLMHYLTSAHGQLNALVWEHSFIYVMSFTSVKLIDREESNTIYPIYRLNNYTTFWSGLVLISLDYGCSW